MSEVAFDPSVGVGEDGEPSGVGEPSTETAPVVEEPTPAAPYTPTPEDIRGWVTEAIQPYLPQPETPRQLTAADFVTTDELGEQVIDMAGLDAHYNSLVDAKLQQALSTYLPILNEVVSDRGNGLVNSYFEESIQGKDTYGEFDRDLARLIGEGKAATVGGDPRTVVSDAAQALIEHDERVAAAAIEKYKTTLGNIGGAPNNPGAAGAAYQDEGEPKTYDEAIGRYLARRGLT